MDHRTTSQEASPNGHQKPESAAPAHTPTPWDHTGGDIWIDSRRQVCCGRGYTECCGEPDVEGGQELVAQTSEANAAFIVKTVNNHDALVKAMEAACGYLLNAKIDLETGCTKATAIKTIEGGIKRIHETLSRVTAV